MQVATNLIARLGEWDVSITTEPFPFQVSQKHQRIGIKLFLITDMAWSPFSSPIISICHHHWKKE
jgi:hypothetical protein